MLKLNWSAAKIYELATSNSCIKTNYVVHPLINSIYYSVSSIFMTNAQTTNDAHKLINPRSNVRKFYAPFCKLFPRHKKLFHCKVSPLNYSKHWAISIRTNSLNGCAVVIVQFIELITQIQVRILWHRASLHCVSPEGQSFSDRPSERRDLLTTGRNKGRGAPEGLALGLL